MPQRKAGWTSLCFPLSEDLTPRPVSEDITVSAKQDVLGGIMKIGLGRPGDISQLTDGMTLARPRHLSELQGP